MAAVNEAIEWRPAVKRDTVKLEIKEFQDTGKVVTKGNSQNG